MNIFESLENLAVSEECFDDIMGIVEEYINELNKYDQYRVDKDPKLKKEIENRQEALRGIGEIRKSVKNAFAGHKAVDTLADENREALGRNDKEGYSKISYASPERHAKVDPTFSDQKAIRTEQSRRGSSKDVWNRMDPLMNKVRKLKR